MTTMFRWTVMGSLMALAACGGGDGPAPLDAQTSDATTADSAIPDSSVQLDLGAPDAGAFDGSTVADGATTDSGRSSCVSEFPLEWLGGEAGAEANGRYSLVREPAMTVGFASFETGHRTGRTAFNFNGATRWISRDTSRGFFQGFSNEITVAVWFLIPSGTDLSAANGQIVNKRVVRSPSDADGFALSLEAGRARFFAGTSSWRTELLSAGSWIHVVGTYDGSSIRGYVNGALNGERAVLNGREQLVNAAPIVIGGTETGDYFTGRVSTVTVYCYAMTEEQVRGEYVASM